MIEPSELQQIEADGRKFAAQFTGFLKCAEALGRIGSLEQAEKEAIERLQRARNDEKAAVVAAAAQKAENEKALVSHSAEIAARNVEADKYLEGRRVEVDNIIADARKQAETILAAAKQDADTLRLNADASIASKRDELSKLTSEAVASRNEIDVLRATHAELAQQFAAKTREFDEHRSRYKKFLASIGVPAEKGSAGR